jgi:hypothetical protein
MLNIMLHPPHMDGVDAAGTAGDGGWSWIADNKEGDKFGLIATKPGAHVALKLNVSQVVTIGFLHSYEKVGRASAWLHASPALPDEAREFCNFGTKPPASMLSPTTLESLWTEKASMFDSVSLPVKLPREAAIFLHLCLQKTKFPKFKLLTVSSK